MYAHVSPMRHHGKALEQTAIRTAPTVKGELLITHENSDALGRYSDVARFRAGAGHNNEILPALFDCRLSHMGTNGFVLSGLTLEGSIAFAQSWWCRLIP